jgi:hypothetical protein
LRHELDETRAKLARAEEDERYARDELEVARVALVEEVQERAGVTRELKATHDLQVWDLEDYIQVGVESNRIARRPRDEYRAVPPTLPTLINPTLLSPLSSRSRTSSFARATPRPSGTKTSNERRRDRRHRRSVGSGT